MLSLGVGGCGAKEDPFPSYCEDFDLGWVGYGDIAPVLEVSCVPCHAQDAPERYGALPSVNFEDYARAVPYARRIAVRTLLGDMPPLPEETEIVVPAVSRRDQCRVAAWYEQGTPP